MHPQFRAASTARTLAAFRTDRYTIKVKIHSDGTWSYQQDTLLIIPGQSEPFHHTDRNRLRKIAEPTPDPLALAAGMRATVDGPKTMRT